MQRNKTGQALTGGGVDRSRFLKQAAGLPLLSALGSWAATAESDRWSRVLPMRKLTRDGQRVTAFCLGGYHLGFSEDATKVERMIERSMELGIRFFDNARGYHKGRSEDYMGRFLTPKYRKEIFLMTKAPAKDAAGVRRQLDESLKALKTDYIDLWQMHDLTTPEDVDRRIREGVLDVFLEAKAKGKVRYIGFTGHRNPGTHLHFLNFLEERGMQMDTCQMPLNVCDPSFESFELRVLPKLVDLGYGVIAMKTMAGGSMMGGRIDTTPDDIRTKDIPDVVSATELSLANLHQYVYALPVSTVCSGCREMEEMEANVEVLRNLTALSNADRQRLIDIARPYAGTVVENYKRLLS